jgi:hypothetical protein
MPDDRRDPLQKSGDAEPKDDAEHHANMWVELFGTHLFILR